MIYWMAISHRTNKTTNKPEQTSNEQQTLTWRQCLNSKFVERMVHATTGYSVTAYKETIYRWPLVIHQLGSLHGCTQRAFRVQSRGWKKV